MVKVVGTLPHRPRLADHALARRHVTDGQERVTLHDTRTGGLIVLGAREWGLLSCADGTRDLDGIVVAAAREGAHARVPALRAFLEQLHAAGLIAEGAAEADPGSATAPAAGVVADRPLDVLPDFSLRCDGSGSCCRLYASVVFSPLEAARARAAAPEVLDAGMRPDRAFLPERGAGPCAGAVVALVNGRCAYLEAEGRACTVHKVAGGAAKPLGCRLFPATFADDGEVIRVSVAVECACVLASVGSRGGAPILPGRPRVRGDLDPVLHVASVPERVALGAGAWAPRPDLVIWSRCVAAAPAPADAAAALWALAGAAERAGLDPGAAGGALAAPAALPAEQVLPWIAALAARAQRRRARDAAWRSERDLALQATAWIAGAATALLDPPALARALAAGAAPSCSEAFYLRAAIHGHHLIGDAPLADALRDRAARLLVARAMQLDLVDRPDDSSAAHPLALVEAMLRGHGLDAYVHDLNPFAG